MIHQEARSADGATGKGQEARSAAGATGKGQEARSAAGATGKGQEDRARGGEAARRLDAWDRLEATAARCALRVAPLPRDLVDDLRGGLDRALAAGLPMTLERRMLGDAAHAAVVWPDSPEALSTLQAVCTFTRARRMALAAEIDGGAPWWQRDAGGMG